MAKAKSTTKQSRNLGGRPRKDNPKSRITAMITPQTVKKVDRYTHLSQARSRSEAIEELLVFGLETVLPLMEKAQQLLKNKDENAFKQASEALGGIDPGMLVESLFKNPRMMIATSDLLRSIFSQGPEQQDLFSEQSTTNQKSKD